MASKSIGKRFKVQVDAQGRQTIVKRQGGFGDVSAKIRAAKSKRTRVARRII